MRARYPWPDEDLSGTQRRLRALFDNIPAGLSLRDLSGRYIMVNEYVAHSLGTPAEELVGADPADHLDDVTAERVRRNDAELIASRRPLVVDVSLPHPDGNVHDYHVVQFPVLDEAGAVEAFGAFVLDVTGLRRSERALVAAEERFRSAFDSAPIGMAIADLDGRYERVNEAFCELTGYTADELLHLGIADVTHPDDRKRTAEVLGLLVDAQLVQYDREKRYTRKDGTTIWVLAHLTSISGSEDGSRRLLVQVVDITERRRREDRLVHMAEHDELTGLLNRRAFEGALEQHLSDATRAGHGGALLLLDLDNFKAVNDALGHATGDRLLEGVAAAMRDHVRHTDVVGRLGGDEFAILLQEASRVSVERVAQGVMTDASERARAVVGDGGPAVTVSVGAIALGDGMASSADALAAADDAMYEAKAWGRSRYTVRGFDERG